jgi:DNA-binding CsgD family transcriptional regulator
VRLDRGDWAGAELDTQAALVERDQAGHRVVEALSVLGMLQARRGDPAAAETVREAADRAAGSNELQCIGPAAIACAELAWLTGVPAEIGPAVEHAFALARSNRHLWMTGQLAFWLHTGGGLVPPGAVVPEPYQLLLAGDWAAAARVWEAKDFVYQRALALSVGDETAQREALAVFDRLGAHATSQRVRQQLRRRGAVGVSRGPIRATAKNPAGLTARQLDVLTELAAGRTTAQIAAALSLSVRTVEHHLAAIYAKLGVTGRAAAIDAVRALNLPVGTDAKLGRRRP